ncbi:unnamed protein product [Didymodactylos carnosus]|uniref:Uncharacterized protein n=1 Tax=Didymodactylos carnosus TaxID=1234261 RepID=A0A8S2DLK2_9BILA|nr:unnamed protein product [Didymodactylos carnosus]CAF3724141.1 unnamed protein product [Didymodactylos carnosus]CAF4460836.1 unnamed protein product [Didymodactylos carnosus]
MQDAICNRTVPVENVAGPDSAFVQQGQNITRDLMSQPALMAPWIPMFTGQHFGYQHPVSFRQPFERRSVIDLHPHGPLPSFISPDHPVFTDIIAAARTDLQ